MALLYQITRKSQVFLYFLRFSPYFYTIFVLKLCKLPCRISSHAGEISLNLVSKSYKLFHCESYCVIFDKILSPSSYGNLSRRVRQRSFFFDLEFPPLWGLTFPKKCAKFWSEKAKTKTRVWGKPPREGPVCCNGSVVLPQTIPLPSRIGGNAMPGTPVTASMSDDENSS